MAGQKQAETSRNQQKKRMGQSGIALQYAENHDGIEGYFNPRGVEKLQFLGGRPPSPPERVFAQDFRTYRSFIGRNQHERTY